MTKLFVITYIDCFGIKIQSYQSLSTSKMASAPESKRKCRQYKDEYLQYGFTHQPNNSQIPLCLLWAFFCPDSGSMGIKVWEALD